jgi:hypothetical protein
LGAKPGFAVAVEFSRYSPHPTTVTTDLQRSHFESIFAPFGVCVVGLKERRGAMLSAPFDCVRRK